LVALFGVEIWPTCIVVPPGYRIVLGVRGKDYEYRGSVTIHTGASCPSFLLLPVIGE
jgi:uncharacterized protein